MVKSLFTCFLVLFSFGSISAFDQEVALKGKIDLAAAKFNGDGLKSLDGEWEFYWRELYNPVFFEASQVTPTFIQVPSLWNGQTIDGNLLEGYGYATYRLQVFLPTDHPGLALFVPDMFSSYRIFINGAVFAENGVVATTKEQGTPNWLPISRTIADDSDTLDIVIHVANYWHHRGGIVQGIRIGESAKVLNLARAQWAYDWVMVGALFMSGLFFIGLYFFGRNDKAILFFSLFCIFYSYRIIRFNVYELHLIFPDLPWTITIFLEYFTLYLCILMFVQYIRCLFPDEVKRWAVNLISYVTVALGAITIVAPLSVYSMVLPYYFMFLLLFIVYGIYIIYLAVKHKRIAAKYAFVSTLIVFAVFLNSMVTYFGLMPRNLAFELTVNLAFFFSQSLILSFRFSEVLKTSLVKAEQASKAKSEFLSTMSHEMRTPLNAVVGFTNILIQENPRKDQQENLSNLKFSAENLMALINDVLDYSKIEAGKVDFHYSPANLKVLTANIVKGLSQTAREKGLDLQLSVDEAIPLYVKVDQQRLTQILYNLLFNAIKFTRQGFVLIEVRLVNQTSTHATILFEVRDSGIGISDTHQGFIFESFSQVSSSSTREFGGTGLGLSITRRLLELQGSKISVESELGKGSRFYFELELQLSDDGEVALQEAKPKMEEAFLGKTILLAEDNYVNTLVVRKFLTKWGAELDLAENGLEAVKMAAAKKYDLILMDLQMPVMDGYTASGEIRKLYPYLPIIAITASVLMDAQSKITSAGMNDYITKPFVPEDFFDKLRKYLAVDR